MADQYDGLDEAALKEMMETAQTYEERSAIRKAIRNLKGSKSKKQVGSSNYRRAGWQAPKSVSIPNSVTGNIMPVKVNVTENILETPKTQSTTSYLKSKEMPYGNQGRRKSSGTGVSNGISNRSSPRESVSSYTSVTPEPKDLAEPEKAPEVVKAEPVEEAVSPEPPREPTPEPPREPTPEPEREPSPPPRSPTPPPRSPTPEPPREPTPEPPREATPEPAREPSPEPIRDPSPEPVRESTPELELSPEPREAEAAADSADEPGESEGEELSEGDDDEGEYEEDDDEDSEEVGVCSDKDAHQYRGGRSSYDPSRVGVKTSLPLEVLTKKEEGIDGDFRKKLRKAEETKIDTTKAFPQAKPKGEQVDFRNVLRKASGPEKKTIRTGAAAQSDFRGSLKGRPSSDKPRSHRRREETADDEEQREPEPVVEPELESIESETIESQSVELEPEPEEEVPEPVVVEEEPQEPQEEPSENQVDTPEPEKKEETDSYESRMAERRRRRAERSNEMHTMEVSKNEKSVKPPVDNGVEEDSYEARREARRKAREERQKAASAGGDDKPRMTYRERKALENKKQMDNAKESRNKWSNMEEESGDKAEAKGANFKKKDSATGQLLAWCQHKTRFYENVEVKDFRSSWADGMAFCAIIHSFLPDKIPYDDLSPSDPRKNFTIAFEAAKEAGIPEMLDVEDMVTVKIPDARSIMTFLVTIYQHFN